MRSLKGKKNNVPERGFEAERSQTVIGMGLTRKTAVHAGGRTKVVTKSRGAHAT